MRRGLTVPNWREDNFELRPKSELRKLSIAKIPMTFNDNEWSPLAVSIKEVSAKCIALGRRAGGVWEQIFVLIFT